MKNKYAYLWSTLKLYYSLSAIKILKLLKKKKLNKLYWKTN